MCECSNSDSTVTTEVSVGVSARQLHDLLTDVINTVRTDVVTMTETKFKDVVKIMETKQFSTASELFKYKIRFFNYYAEFKFQMAGSDREYNS